MLRDMPWLRFSDGIEIELMESKDEGKCIEAFEERIKSVSLMDEGTNKEALAGGIFDDLAKLPVKEGYYYIEPSDINGINDSKLFNDTKIKPDKANLSDEVLYDKIYGAWLGRCAGCLLGQPIEGWYKSRIDVLLKGTNNYPLNSYISSIIPEDIKRECEVTDYPGAYGNEMKSWINNVKYMPEDDDINYTIMGLKIVEKYGVDFTPEDVAECWLTNLPILHVCTAERVAYRNLVNMITPPYSAYYRNPYREWIGAQIRADFFGYITPGKPEMGAYMAWKDASISHTKNGIYGEMFIAAMLSAAAVNDDIESIIHAGLSQIPVKSRLYNNIKTVLEWKRTGINWECAIERIHQMYDEKNPYDWCHTIPNAMIVCIGLLYGGHDLGDSICKSVMAAFDTDCNGATVGSILGMIIGAKALPQKWIKPLNNTLKSGIDGFGLVEISNLANRTVNIAKGI